MLALAIEFEGSGALQYLRPEIINPPGIQMVIGELPKQIVHSNAMTLPQTIVISDLQEGRKFDAQTDLLQLQPTFAQRIRQGAPIVSSCRH